MTLRYAILLIVALSYPAYADDPRRDSGFPIPRFVSLKSNEINIRSGPGTRYPILWVYHREGLTMEVVEEFEHWRKIRDIDGVSGWVHKSMIDGKRTVLVKGKTQVLRAEPEDKAAAVLRAQPMVLAKLVECEKTWCKLQIEGRKGWMRRTQIWGVYENEEIKK